MRYKKKWSFFRVMYALLLVIAVLLAMIDVAIYSRYYRSGLYKSMLNPSEKIDMTVADDNTEFGILYYAPVEEEHIVEFEEEGVGYIDNEVLIVTCDGVTREQVAELAAAYDSEIVGEISVTEDYQLRLSAVPVELEAIVESISAEPLVESATLNYVSAVSGEADIGSFYFGREWDGEFKRYPPAFYKAWGFNKIKTAVAWNELDAHASEIAPVKVGVCDVGFAPNHPDLGFVQFFYDNGAYGVDTKNKDKYRAVLI